MRGRLRSKDATKLISERFVPKAKKAAATAPKQMKKSAPSAHKRPRKGRIVDSDDSDADDDDIVLVESDDNGDGDALTVTEADVNNASSSSHRTSIPRKNAMKAFLKAVSAPPVDGRIFDDEKRHVVKKERPKGATIAASKGRPGLAAAPAASPHESKIQGLRDQLNIYVGMLQKARALAESRAASGSAQPTAPIMNETTCQTHLEDLRAFRRLVLSEVK